MPQSHPGFEETRFPIGVTRRQALRAGAAGLLGLALDSLPDARAEAAAEPFPAEAGRYWPQAAGPHGTWSVDANDAPIRWSGARNEGFAWRTTLPEEGQGGIAVWGDRVFVTTLKPEEGKRPNGKEVVGYCLDARNGKVLWTVELPGSTASVPAYFFSDATSPSPITDGKHVWFFNACGSVGCYDCDGAKVWLREWEPTTNKRPFNKQFEPMLFGDFLLNMEPRDAGDPKREADPWNYIRGLDRKTGKSLWVAEDALTHYNTPVFGVATDGAPAVLQGRGAYHGVPEAPVGLSLTSLAPGREGKTLWRYEGKGKATYTQHWNAKYACWIALDTAEHVVLDAADGKPLRTQSLVEKVDWRRYDADAGKYVLQTDVNLAKQMPPLSVFPAQFCNILCWRPPLLPVRHRGVEEARAALLRRPGASGDGKGRVPRSSGVGGPRGGQAGPFRVRQATDLLDGQLARDRRGGGPAVARRRLVVGLPRQPDGGRRQDLFHDHAGRHLRHRRPGRGAGRKGAAGRQRPGRAGPHVEPQLDQLRRGAAVPPQHEGDRLRRLVRTDDVATFPPAPPSATDTGRRPGAGAALLRP